MGRVLLVDDDPAMILDQAIHALRPQGIRIEVAHTAEEGLRQIAAQPPDVILLDVHLPDLSGLDAYQRIRQIDGRIPVIFITWAATADTAIEAMKEGAYDYLFKPLDLARLRSVVVQALELGRLMRRPAVVAQTPPAEDGGDAIIGRCPAMGEVYKAIGRVAAQNVIVLITGESGTGKELVARAIYQHSPRAGRPSWRSTALPSRKACWRASCSATRRAPLPAPTAAASASSSSAPAARSSWTRSATCRWQRRRRSCAYSKTRGSSGWGATRRSTPTCA